MRVTCSVIALVIGLLAVAPRADQTSAVYPTGGTSSYTRIISPVAVVSVVASAAGPGPKVLDLLVLWRGSPGWFFRTAGHRSSGGGSGTTFSETFSFGGVELQFEVDFATRNAIIQGQKVELKNDNVVLVDHVDTAGQLKIVGTLRVDPKLDDEDRIEPVLRQSEQLLSFLRCDLKLDDPKRQAAVERICAMVMGK